MKIVRGIYTLVSFYIQFGETIIEKHMLILKTYKQLIYVLHLFHNILNCFGVKVTKEWFNGF